MSKYNFFIILFIFITYLAVYILLKKIRKTRIKQIFHKFILIIASISLSEFGFYSTPKDFVYQQVFWAIINSFWVFIPFYQLKFIIYFTNKNQNNFFKTLQSLFFIAALIIMGIFDFTIISEFLINQKVFFNLSNNYLMIFITIIWALIIFLISIFLCFEYLIKVKNKTLKIQSFLLIIAMFFPFMASIIFKDILPLIFNIHYEEIGTVLTFFSIIIFSYAIIKYELFIISPEMVAEEIIDTIHDALILIDSNLNVVKVNKSLTQLIGFEEKEIINYKIDKLISKTNIDINIIIENLRKNHKYIEEHYIVNHENKKIPVSLSVSPLLDKRNDFIGYVFILRDLSKIMDLMKEKEDLQDQLFQSQKLESLGYLAGGIAHDFNNSIGAIILLAEDANDRFGNKIPDLKEYFDDILTASNQVKDLTNKLLTFARKGKYEISTFDFHDVIDEVIKILSRTINKKIKIEQNLNACESMIKGDFRQLQNSLFNIALNARDAMFDGGILKFETKTVNYDEIDDLNFVKQNGQDLYLKICIIDNGLGMDSNVLEKIFDPFFTTKPSGTGFGLSSVYGIIKNHNGYIKVESIPQKGTTFCFYLPCIVGVYIEDKKEGNEISTGKGKILVVDDQDSVRISCLRVLTTLGYNTHGCIDGEEALKYYKENFQNIDLILLDLIMPKLNGSQCFLELKKINPYVKVIVMTGYTNEGEATSLLNQGAIDFIEKPFTKNIISEKIKNILS